jgi:hypothetical protein
MTATDPERRWRLMPVTFGFTSGLLGLVLGSTVWDVPGLWFPCFAGGLLVGWCISVIHTRRQQGDDGQ